MNISLEKKYVTLKNTDVILFEISDNIAFGKFIDPCTNNWRACSWDVTTGTSIELIAEIYQLKEKQLFKPNSATFKSHEKIVNYFGVNFIVNNSIDYLATDKDGTLRGFKKEQPKPGRGFWNNVAEYDSIIIGHFGSYDGDWEDSLQKV